MRLILNLIRNAAQRVGLPISALAILFAFISLAPAQTRKRPPSTAADSPVNKKTEREILKMEERLRLAVARRDVRAIDRMLIDYYSSSREGSDRGLPKKATMAGYANGTLPFYAINENRKLSARAEFIIIEGVSRAKSASADGEDDDKEVRVKRFWANKDGRWQVVMQTFQPIESEHER